MTTPSPFEPMPRMRLLRVFECTARLGSFSAAAEELHTTQSAVSRAVAELERQLAARLFDRSHRGVRLTSGGELYRDAVVAGLARIGAAGASLAGAQTPHVVIACGHAVSTLFLMPMRAALYRAVGGGRHPRPHPDLRRRPAGSGGRERSRHRARLRPRRRRRPGTGWWRLRQAVTPVCAPAYACEHTGVLARPVEEWGGLTFLDTARPSRGWATWEDWFEAAGRPLGEPRRLRYFDYVFLLEDALAGAGLALGWRRLVERHLESGALVAVAAGFVEVDRPHYARLTKRGRGRRHARRCLGIVRRPVPARGRGVSAHRAGPARRHRAGRVRTAPAPAGALPRPPHHRPMARKPCSLPRSADRSRRPRAGATRAVAPVRARVRLKPRLPPVTTRQALRVRNAENG